MESLTRDRLFLFFSPPIAAIAPVYQVYEVNNIRLFDPAPLAYLSGVLVCAALLGLALAVLRGGKVRVFSLMEASLLAVVLLMLADMVGGARDMMSWITLPYGRRLLVGSLFLALASVLWVLREKSPTILFAGALALCVSTLLVPTGGLISGAHARTNQSGPVVYIIVDEMIGLEGLPREISGGEDVHSLVKSVFLTHNFRIYSRAFSRHFMSQRSIPAVLNFDDYDNGASDVSQYSNADGTFKRLRLLERLEDNGNLVIYQSGHLDWCAPLRKAECRTFPSFDVSRWIPPTDSPFGAIRYRLAAHAALMGQVFSGTYLLSAYSHLLHGLAPVFDGPVVTPNFVDIHGFPQWFSEFSDEVMRREADYYFAHFLMPHSPSVLNADCEPELRWVAPYYLAELKGLAGPELDAARAQYYGFYLEQVTCLMRTLDNFFTQLKQAEAFEGATIVVHGDHGSRISAGRLPANLSRRDLIDNYSTLYAIKAPNVDPGVDQRQISIQRLSAEYLGDRDVDLSRAPSKTVVAGDGKEGGLIRLMPMPELPDGDQ